MLLSFIVSHLIFDVWCLYNANLSTSDRVCSLWEWKWNMKEALWRWQQGWGAISSSPGRLQKLEVLHCRAHRKLSQLFVSFWLSQSCLWVPWLLSASLAALTTREPFLSISWVTTASFQTLFLISNSIPWISQGSCHFFPLMPAPESASLPIPPCGLAIIHFAPCTSLIAPCTKALPGGCMDVWMSFHCLSSTEKSAAGGAVMLWGHVPTLRHFLSSLEAFACSQRNIFLAAEK